MEDLSDRGITPVEMDVSKGEDNARAVREIVDAHGRIYVLINNAGFGLCGPVEEIPLEDARYQFEVNLFGLAHLTQLVPPHLRAQRSGRIVSVSSMGGRIFTPRGARYHATKHALEGWSDCLRMETAPFNIQVVAVQPGAIRTELGDMMEARLRKYSEDRPKGPSGLAAGADGQPRTRFPGHRAGSYRQGVRQGREGDTSADSWRAP